MLDLRKGRTETVAAYYDAYNGARPEDVLVCYADDAVLEEVASGRSHAGFDALRAGLSRFFGLFADLRFADLRPVVAGDVILCSYRLSAVVQADIGPHRLAGRRIGLTGAHLFDFSGTRIQRCRDFWDFDELVAQAAEPGQQGESQWRSGTSI